MTTRFFVDTNGVYQGGWDGSEPPSGLIEVPTAPEHASQIWDFVTETWSPPPVPIYSLQVSNIWGRMSDEEAETFDAAVATAPPLRLRRQFQSATAMNSDSELFGFVENILVGLFDQLRTDELLAEGLPSASLELAPTE